MKKMRNVALIFMAAAIMAACGGGAKQDPAEVSKTLTPGAKPEDAVVKTVDASASTVEWIGTKITGQHNGTIGLSSGELYLVNEQVVGGKIVIDMSQITVVDIEDAEMNARLKGHLESDDFFSVATHPQATFEMANIVKNEAASEGEPNYTISGNLTIKGITNAVTFPAHVHMTDGVLTAKADFELDRTMWDVRFGSGRFFEGLGDNLIHDNFSITLDIAAK